MFTRAGSISPYSVSRLAWLVVFAAVASPCADHPAVSSGKQPRVTSVTQITRNGVSKTNLLADDSNLYVTEWPTARHVIAKVSLSDASRAVISSVVPNVQALDISPDGSKLLVSPVQGSDSEFWTLPLNASAPQQLSGLSGRDAAWSPDGQSLVFSKGSKLYLASADGSSPRELYAANGSVYGARFSPDGKRIRFTVGNIAQNATEIWEVGINNSNPHPVLGDWSGRSTACCGNWTPDGRYYIFQMTQGAPTTVTTLWALADSVAASVPAQLTSGPMSFGNAALARDSKNLWAIGVQPLGEAVRYNAKKKGFEPLLSSVSGTDLDYSADGKWVAYVSIPDATLWRCRADGSERLQLTFAPERVALPRWSPDGKRIAYVSLQPGKPSKISLLARDGGTPEDLFDENRAQIDANWSADGKRIMFGYLHDVEGKDIRVVHVTTHTAEVVPGSGGLFSPRWSPDGRYVAALTPDFTTVRLFDYRTQKWTTWFAEPAGAVSYPVWSADSKYVYFDDLVTDEESIRRVRVGLSKPERVLKLEGIERYPGTFGLWSGRTPDGSWMFVRDRSTQEVYQLAVELP